MSPKTRILILLTFSLSLLLAGTQMAFCQKRGLPPASFGSYSGGGVTGPGSGGYDGGLEPTSGFTLTPSLSRSSKDVGQPYNPGEPKLNGALVRWQRSSMPLKVWISPGLKLPEMPMDELNATRVDFVYNMMKQADPLVGLEKAPGWKSEMNDLAADGIEEWRIFQDEGLISFGFVDDPKLAHILVFWTDSFKDGSMGGVSIGANTCAQLFTLDQTKLPNFRQKPTIIEISTFVNEGEAKMRGAAAHEFGHALGIKEHSPYRQDIMFKDRVVNELSPSDKATLRALYRIPSTPYVF